MYNEEKQIKQNHERNIITRDHSDNESMHNKVEIIYEIILKGLK